MPAPSTTDEITCRTPAPAHCVCLNANPAQLLTIEKAGQLH